MMASKTKDIFPVFDPITEEFLYHKKRTLVHVDGDWHKGIQANIIRPNRQGTFDILLQKRSAVVDISPHKYDQSLATQMLDLDNKDESIALQRGLHSELNIERYDARRLDATLRIVKTYQNQPQLLNRELISLWIVQVEADKDIIPASPKIGLLEWVEWHDCLKMLNNSPDSFTKTGKFYFTDATFAPYIEQASYALLRKETVPDPPATAILHIDKWKTGQITYRGNLESILVESGEV